MSYDVTLFNIWGGKRAFRTPAPAGYTATPVIRPIPYSEVALPMATNHVVEPVTVKG